MEERSYDNISINQLRIFSVAAATQNFTKAAEELYYTTPYVSRKIAALEENLGVKLFNRVNQRVILTAEGELFLIEVKSILKKFDSTVHKLNILNDPAQKILDIGIFSVSQSTEYMTAVANMFNEKYPDVELDFDNIRFSELETEIMSERFDVIYTVKKMRKIVENAGYKFYPLYRSKACILMPWSHPLANEKNLTLEKLADSRIVILKDSAFSDMYYGPIMEYLKGFGYDFSKLIKVNDLDSIVFEMKRSNAITLMDTYYNINDPDVFRTIEIEENINELYDYGGGIACLGSNNPYVKYLIKCSKALIPK